MLSRILGTVLKGVHAGEARLAWNHPAAAAPQLLTLSSASFPKEGVIPRRYAGRGAGENCSPALAWSRPPEGTRELVLIMEDPDAPLRRPFVHLIAHGIAPQASGLPEGALEPSAAGTPVFGRNTFGGVGYQGPRALPGHGPHRYVFQIFALNRPLALHQPARLGDLLAAMQGSVIARGRLDGFFEQK